jgi:hypothetical protein
MSLKCNLSTKVVIKCKHEYEEHYMTYVFNTLVCIITLHKISMLHFDNENLNYSIPIFYLYFWNLNIFIIIF